MSYKLKVVVLLLVASIDSLVLAKNDVSQKLQGESFTVESALLKSKEPEGDSLLCKPKAELKKLFDLHNTARKNGVSCGRNRAKTAKKLHYSCQLSAASMRHAQDLSKHQFLKHVGSDGSKFGLRATESGYVWRRVGENIASGFKVAKKVNDAWLTSPGHCKNIINSDYIDMGAAQVGKYWVVMFGRR